ncbi:MAG: tetratricopeptide repeat protein [Spirochaetales bacterium]|nr:MAG: tetratricopeptide repeat protein [Spirochaetales bacterium]
MKKTIILLLFFILPGIVLFSLSFFEQGEELFLKNQPEKALIMLEAALGETPLNDKVYLYLGIIYEQLGQYEKAVGILRLGLDSVSKDKETLYFNIANNLFRLNDLDGAEAMYGEVLRNSPAFADAYLNRANARIKLNKLKNAAEDYIKYIALRPSTTQRENIEKVISLIQFSLAEQERQKQEEERSKAEAEKKRIEDEKRKAEEEVKRIEDEKKRQAEEEKAKAEAEKKRIEDEKLKAEEEKKRIEEEKKRQAEEEKARIEAEKKRIEEEKRKAEEEKKRAEAEKAKQEEERKRQEALLKEVMESLKNASIETKNKKAGSEDIQSNDFNLDLKD